MRNVWLQMKGQPTHPTQETPHNFPKTTRNTYFANSSVPGNVCHWYNITCETKYQLWVNMSKSKCWSKALTWTINVYIVVLRWMSISAWACTHHRFKVLRNKTTATKIAWKYTYGIHLRGWIPPHSADLPEKGVNDPWNPLNKHVLASSKLHISTWRWVSKVGFFPSVSVFFCSLQALWH